MAPQNADAFLAEALVRTGSDALPYNREFVSLVHQHLLELVEDFPALRLKAQPYTHLDGRTSTLLCAQGTVPMHYGGHKYNIPVAVWLPENYPLQRPIVYVVPSHNMIIKPRHSFVNASGLVATMYLDNWAYPRSNLLDMAQDMAMLFGSDPPLFEKPPLREQPPVIGKPPWVEQPTPWVEKPKPPPPPPKHTQESLLSAFRTAAVAELTARLQASLTVATNKAAAEAHRQMDQQVELRRREATLQQEVHALQAERLALDKRAQDLSASNQQLEAWLAENEARAAALNEGSLNPDNMLTAADPLSQQALEAQAEDLAMEDCLYELDKALQAGRVAPEAYLRQVRAVCRRQFTARVLGLKISAAQQEQQRRAAAAPQGARGGGAAYAASAAMVMPQGDSWSTTSMLTNPLATQHL